MSSSRPTNPRMIAAPNSLEAELLHHLLLDEQALEEGLLPDFSVVHAPLVVSSLGVSTRGAVR